MSLLWKIGGAAVLMVAAYFLVTMYGSAREERGRLAERVIWQQKGIDAEKSKMVAFRQGLDRQQAAETRYIETVRTLPPVTNTIIERAATYAATPAGAVQCLPADRVLRLDEARDALFPAAATAAAGGPAGTVPADPARP